VVCCPRARGQGKSVGLNAIITSLLYKKHPNEMKLVLIDPKKVEFSIYSPIASHFMATLPENENEPIITDVTKVVRTLNSLCKLMDTRYDLLKMASARNIKEYNEKFVNHRLDLTRGHNYMPYIVVVIDELADLMMTERKAVEQQIARLAQKARAAGIHMIVATQRPSVDVVTGLIKANIPTRMAFTVQSKIDSRTILDQMGADELLKYGDSLFLQPGSAEPTRLQGAFVSDDEVHQVVNYVKSQAPADYIEGLLSGEAALETTNIVNPNAGSDELFDQAVAYILESKKTSISSLQRQLRIGYNRAANLMEALENAGVVSPADINGSRRILAQKDQL